MANNEKIDMADIENILNEHKTYIISSVEGKGVHIGRFHGLSLDADGDWVIDADLDEKSCTG